VKKNCQDCHMPLEDAPQGDVVAKGGKVRSHRFLAVNTALPALRGDTDTIKRIETFLQDKKLRVDVFALRRLNPDDSEKEVVTALDLTQPLLVPGEKVEVQSSCATPASATPSGRHARQQRGAGSSSRSGRPARRRCSTAAGSIPRRSCSTRPPTATAT
jgi:hypothetical protein